MTPGGLLAVGLVSTAVAFAVDGLVRLVAIRRGAVVPPRPDRWHRTPTPTFGGIGVMAGLVAGCALGGGFAREAWPVLAAGARALRRRRGTTITRRCRRWPRW